MTRMKEAFLNLGPAGWLALATAVLEFNPLLQAVKAWRTKSAENVSLGTYATIFLIGGIWLVYGISIMNIPLIAGNGIKLLSATATLVVCRSQLKRAVEIETCQLEKE